MLFGGLLATGAPETAVEPETDAPGAVVLKRNGGWCWFQDPRAILLRDGWTGAVQSKPWCFERMPASIGI